MSESFSPDESGDLWVLQLDKNGDIAWQKIYGLPDYWDEALSVGATADGGALIGGYYEEGQKDWDLFLLRLDAKGNALWQRVYEYGWDWPNAIQQLDDGGFVVVGVGWQKDRGEDLDLLVMRLAADGAMGPTCDLVHDLNLKRVDTNATPIPSHAIVKDTHVAPGTSSVRSEDSMATPTYLCQDQTTSNSVLFLPSVIAATEGASSP